MRGRKNGLDTRRGDVWDAAMSDSMSKEEARKARLLCHVAAAVFVACAIGLAVVPFEMEPAVRWVLAGFNVTAAIATALYARTLE